jgi:hypothetical protein
VACAKEMQDGCYYVHVFVAKTLTRGLHGKRLSRDQFRAEENEIPDPKLLSWHYQQCVQARIRGFWVDG